VKTSKRIYRTYPGFILKILYILFMVLTALWYTEYAIRNSEI